MGTNTEQIPSNTDGIAVVADDIRQAMPKRFEYKIARGASSKVELPEHAFASARRDRAEELLKRGQDPNCILADSVLTKNRSTTQRASCSFAAQRASRCQFCPSLNL